MSNRIHSHQPRVLADEIDERLGITKPYPELGMDNAVWDDGEWISWADINEQIRCQEWRATYPNADLSLVPIFEGLLGLAEEYFRLTDRHLQLYGDIGEVYAAITHGVALHSNYAQGSDGRLGNEFVEVKTIAPFNKHDAVTVKLSGHFSKLILVKVNEEFEISSRMIDRKNLPKRKGKVLRIRWADIQNI